jgi:outer membrane protein, heavy metal efflux system
MEAERCDLNWSRTLPAGMLAVLGMAAGICAQEPESPAAVARAPVAQASKPRLTLAEALDLAEKQNLDLAAARAQRAVALAGIRAAGQRPNPTATFQATRDTPHESLFFDQAIEIGGRRGRRIELAKQESMLTEQGITAAERKTRLEVRTAYYALAFARAATAELGTVATLGDRLREIARQRFQAGDIAQLEVTQAELEKARAHADLQVAQQEERVALGELNALLNEPPAMDWDVGDALAAMPPALAMNDLLLRSGASNVELARIGQEQKVQQSQTALLKAERIPNLGLEFGGDFNAPPNFQAGGRGGINMELPIFNRNQGEIAQSLATQKALEQEMAATRRRVDASVESAYFDLEARRLQVQLYRDTLLPSSKKLEEMAEDSYRSGKSNILTVLAAQRDVHQVEREYLDSLVALHAAFGQLEAAVGAPLE